MKLLHLLFGLTLTSLLISGCIQNANQLRSEDLGPSESYLIYADYDAVWQATLKALKKNHFSETIDTGQGIITTQFRPVVPPKEEPVPGEIILKTYQYSYGLQLSSQADAQTELRIGIDIVALNMGVFLQKEQALEIEDGLRKQLLADICIQLYPGEIGRCEAFVHTGGEDPPQVEQPEIAEFTLAPKGHEEIALLQLALINSGYTPGSADGLMGANTRKAIHTFQKNNNLKLTGKVDTKTWAALGLPEDAYQKYLAATAVKTSSQPETAIEVFPLEPQPVKEVAIQPIVTPKHRGILSQPSLLMQSPSINSQSITEIPKGTMVHLLKKKGRFYLVEYKGHKGYVYWGNITTKTVETSQI